MPHLSRAAAFRLAWPMIFANAAVPLAGVVDTAVISAVGDKAALGGVALGVTLFNIFYWSCYFLRMASTGLAAQASGSGNTTELHRILLRALGMSGLLGCGVLLLRSPIGSAGFAILQGGPLVEVAGREYWLGRSWGVPASYAVFAITGWLIGVGRTRAVLVINLVFSVTNILLDLGLVLGLGLGVSGVAWATALADYAAAGIGLWYVLAVVREQGGFDPDSYGWSRLVDLTALRRLLSINTDMMIRSWALLAGFSWFANAGARHGAAILAGNHILMQIVTVWAFVLDAFAFTAETAVGRAIGARSVTALRQGIRVTTEMALGAGALFLVITMLAGPTVLHWFVVDPEARDSAIRFLPYCAVIPLIGAAAWQLDGIFIGAMRSVVMRNASIVATMIYLTADQVLTQRWGPHGMWIAWVLFYVAGREPWPLGIGASHQN